MKRPAGYWTKERCQEEALKYNRRVKFKTKSSSAYNTARKMGLLDEMCKHMTPQLFWTKERCQEEALKYSLRSEFKTGSGCAYNAAHRNGWLEDICQHMVRIIKPRGYWNDRNRVLEAASRHKTLHSFRKESSGAYHSADRNGWLWDVRKVIRKNR